jgi:hypothetical protein
MNTLDPLFVQFASWVDIHVHFSERCYYSALRASMNHEQQRVHGANEVMDGQAVRFTRRAANPLNVYPQFLSFVTYIGGNRIIFTSRLHCALYGIKGAWRGSGRLHYAEVVIPGSNKAPVSVRLSYLQLTHYKLFSVTRVVMCQRVFPIVTLQAVHQ